MHINFNGKYETVSEGVDVLSFLRGRGLDPDKLVVEYNGDILPRQEWATELLNDGDAIVALTIVGGG